MLVLLACTPPRPEAAPEIAIVLTAPEDGDVDVSVATDILVRFDATLDESDRVLELDPEADGTLSWDGPSHTLTLDPTALLDVATTYTVTVPATESSFSFTTADTADTGDGSTFTDGTDTVTVSVSDRDTLTRTYALSTTRELRDNAPNQVTVLEEPGQPVLRSGHDLYDALFALALQEARQNSVSSIQDGAFSNGTAIPCACFQTGELWTYVWTRDSAYATDLALAWVDPIRSRDTLLFKTSPLKSGLGGGDPEIVQDTGSGGSWPVSTDRVVWALGARQTLFFLDEPERSEFSDAAYDVVRNTLVTDRSVVFDAQTGLYRGETSFLDWRSQTYPGWAVANLAEIAQSEALSTNVGHLALLRFAADLAEQHGDTAESADWSSWADALAAEIDARFWREDLGSYGSKLSTALDPSPVAQQDHLGLALAILHGVASPEKATDALSAYPHTAHGPPVVWPEQQETPIYHNRAIWPFVTAYSAKAARVANHDAAASSALSSLYAGAALHLSNQENLEMLSGRPWVDAGPESGPVVNSRRQLWSIAGYLSGVVDVLFGMEVDGDALRFRPYVPAAFRDEVLGASSELALHGLSWRGHALDVVLDLPEGPTTGAFVADSGWFTEADLTGDTIALTLAHQEGEGTLRLVSDTGDPTYLYAPKEPVSVSVTEDGGDVEIVWDDRGETGVTFEIRRDGTLIAEDVTGSGYTDTAVDPSTNSPCYSVTSVYASGLASHPSAPSCLWTRIDALDPHTLVNSGGTWSTANGRTHHEGWGEPDHTLTVSHYAPRWTGPHWLQVEYANGSGGADTGVTAAIKRITVTESGTSIADGALVMPHTGGSWAAWTGSTLVAVDLVAGHSYRIEISDEPNMASREHFASYTAGLGGGADPWNRADIAALKVLSRGGVEVTPAAPERVLDGIDDLGDFSAEHQWVPGVGYDSWDLFALDADEDAVYVALASPAFEDAWKPLVVYFDGSGVSATSGQGITYSGLTPELPFSPTHAVVLRNQSDDGSGFGPYCGVWASDGGWHLVRRFARGTDDFLASDNHTVSASFPRALLGADTVRVAAHVVDATPANEWKDVVPDSHTPWTPSTTGFDSVDLDE